MKLYAIVMSTVRRLSELIIKISFMRLTPETLRFVSDQRLSRNRNVFCVKMYITGVGTAFVSNTQ